MALLSEHVYMKVSAHPLCVSSITKIIDFLSHLYTLKSLLRISLIYEIIDFESHL